MTSAEGYPSHPVTPETFKSQRPHPSGGDRYSKFDLPELRLGSYRFRFCEKQSLGIFHSVEASDMSLSKRTRSGLPPALLKARGYYARTPATSSGILPVFQGIFTQVNIAVFCGFVEFYFNNMTCTAYNNPKTGLSKGVSERIVLSRSGSSGCLFRGTQTKLLSFRSGHIHDLEVVFFWGLSYGD